MNEPAIEGMTIEEMALCHYRHTSDDERRKLQKFIAEQIRDFTDNESGLSAQLLTTTKIELFNKFITEKIRENSDLEIPARKIQAWFVAFTSIWFRNRKGVDNYINTSMPANKEKFYRTIWNEWEGQIKRGNLTDSILEYVTTHPEMGRDPYLTIPTRIEHIRRIRIYATRNGSMDGCKRHLKICDSEFANDTQEGITAGMIPWQFLREHYNLQKHLTLSREANFMVEKSLDDLDVNETEVDTNNQHLKKYVEILKLWKIILLQRMSMIKLDFDKAEKEKGNAIDHVKNVKSHDLALHGYMHQIIEVSEEAKEEGTLRNEKFRETSGGLILEYVKEAITFCKDFKELEEIKNRGREKDNTSVKKEKLDNPSPKLINSIFNVRTNITNQKKRGRKPTPYPVKSPNLGKKHVSADKFVWNKNIITGRRDPDLGEDKTKSSLMNDCRDSAKLAIFLLDKVQLKSANRLNRHVGLILWDLMIKFRWFLSSPTFYQTQKPKTNVTEASAYVSKKGEDLAKELQQIINGVFSKAVEVIESQTPKNQDETIEHKLIPIVIAWKKYINSEFDTDFIPHERTHLGEIRARCGNLIGMPVNDRCESNFSNPEYTKNTKDELKQQLIFFKPKRDGEWSGELYFSEENIEVGGYGERTGES